MAGLTPCSCPTPTLNQSFDVLPGENRESLLNLPAAVDSLGGEGFEDAGSEGDAASVAGSFEEMPTAYINYRYTPTPKAQPPTP